MKKKTIFAGVFAALLFVMSFMICSIYDEVKQNTAYLESSIDDEVRSFIIKESEKLDKSYEPLVFKEGSSEMGKKEVEQAFLDQIDYQGYQNLYNDENFDYWIKNTKTGTISTNQSSKNIPDFKKDSLLFMHIVFDEDGNYSVKDRINMANFDFLNDSYYNLQTDVTLDNGTEIFAEANLQCPKNIEVYFRVPEKPVLNSGYIASRYYSYEGSGNFVLVTLLVSSVILALFLLCYPIQIVKEVQPFKSTSHIKGEIAFFLFTFAIMFASACVVMVSGYSISGVLSMFLEKYGFGYRPNLVFIINMLTWILNLVIIAMTLFYIKYIFACGFVRYLKEDTLIGMLFMKLKNSVDMISNVDMKTPMDKWFFKITFVNFIAIIVCAVLWGAAFIPALIYSIAIFIWMKKKYEAIQVDYLNLQGAAHSLANGNFDVDNDLDVGIFNSLNDEFKNIRSGFEKAVKEETKSQIMKTELITNVSHDLKTPLTGIRNYVELLQQENLDEPTKKEYVGMLQQYTNRLSTLIEDLFEVSKVNSGNIHLDIMELDMNALLEQAQAECSECLDEKQLTILKNSSAPIMVELDGGKTFRIFENLFTNIAKYAMPSTRVYVDIVEKEEKVEIQFKNVSEEQLNFNTEEIVERFVRGDKSRHTSGSGLGLAIVKSFTEAQNGNFKIETDGDLFKAIVVLPKHVEKTE